MDDQYKTTNIIGNNPISDSFFNDQKRLVWPQRRPITEYDTGSTRLFPKT